MTRAREDRPPVTRIVYNSALVSLAAQVLLGTLTLVGMFAGVPKELEDDLFPIFILELSSQIIEFAWYSIVLARYKEITTWTRYLDWWFSTPTMLVSTVLFFLHRSGDDYGEFLRSGRFYMILSFNWLMLAFGFAIERGILPMAIGLTCGFLMLGATFAIMGLYLDGDPLSTGLFVTMVTVWALYGVAAVLPYVQKNVAYNMLDVVSKNFYGLFLTVYSFTV